MAMLRSLHAGFTLIELLVVIAITAILLSLGIPQFSELSAARAVTSHVNLLAGAMRLARAEAVKRGMRVTICPSLAPEATDPICSAAAGDWAEGWIIFSDLGVADTVDGSDRIIRVQPALRGSAGIISTGGVAVNFFPTGVAIGGQRNFTFLPDLNPASPTYDKLAKRMCVENSGATRLRKYAEGC